ncbi:hypothetical protein Q7P37_007363 [Cladosporium fusiforme]
MAPSRALRQSLNSVSQCVRLHTTLRRGFATPARLQNEGSHLPRVANPSLWRSLVPKFLRRDGESGVKKIKSKDWNPATIFIVLGIIVGSNAINILALRREMLNFSRKTEAKLTVLREVLQRVKNGEDVDVEKMLGTGNPEQEKEWENVMNEIENTDMLAEAKKKREAKEAAREAARVAAQEAAAKEQSGDGKGGDGASSKRPKFMM